MVNSTPRPLYSRYPLYSRLDTLENLVLVVADFLFYVQHVIEGQHIKILSMRSQYGRSSHENVNTTPEL